MSCIMLFACNGCNETLVSDPQEEYMIRLDKVLNGAEIDICDPVVRFYLELTDEREIGRLLQQYSGVNKDFQTLEITWSSQSLTDYTIHISETEDFSCVYTEEMRNTEWHASALIPGKTYYYKIVAKTGEESMVDFFRTKDLPVRYINVAGGLNIRDIGGWTTESGRQVAYGKIYRGGNFDNTTFLYGGGKKLLCEVLGVKSEIDLRTFGGDDGGQESSIFGTNCLYTKATISAYSHILPQFKWANGDSRYVTSTVNGIKLLFSHLSDADNYPLYLHCNAGADRTGTAVFLINGLLGVSYEDLTRDFELTSFSNSGRRWRSDINNDTFTGDGVMEDNIATNYVGWGKMYRQLMQYYGQEGTLSLAIERYLVEHCEIPQKQIDSVKQIMLGEN